MDLLALDGVRLAHLCAQGLELLGARILVLVRDLHRITLAVEHAPLLVNEQPPLVAGDGDGCGGDLGERWVARRNKLAREAAQRPPTVDPLHDGMEFLVVRGARPPEVLEGAREVDVRLFLLAEVLGDETRRAPHRDRRGGDVDVVTRIRPFLHALEEGGALERHNFHVGESRAGPLVAQCRASDNHVLPPVLVEGDWLAAAHGGAARDDAQGGLVVGDGLALLVSEVREALG